VIAGVILAVLATATSAAAAPDLPAGTVKVGPGVYRPAFPSSPTEREVPVAAFALDRAPVTNAAYLRFVRARPEWRRDRVKPLVADHRYLGHWAGPEHLGTARPDAPVVGVSWFAARAYCSWRGGRLPVEKEWELAAAADETRHDASGDPAFQRRILDWYTELAPAVLPDVGGSANAWGVRDLHGLVWEWIDDFNSALVSADSRTPGTAQFCGGTAASSKDPGAYATFMRLAFRSSLDARFTTATLGFRCAHDLGSPS
jgi:formylglycine-generating enzyme